MKLPASVGLLIPDLRLVVATTIRGLRDDPLHFLLQMARRLRLAPAPRSERATLTNAVRWYLADRPEQASAILSHVPEPRGWRRRLHRWLSVQLGLSAARPDDSSRLRWQAANLVGDLSGALQQAAPGSSAHRRTASELRVLAPSSRPVRHMGGRGPALFILTNSLPHTRSGYTARTQSILTALQDAGGKVTAATRIGYPTTVGLPGQPRSRVVDGVEYHRLVTSSLPLEIDQRLDAQRHLLRQLARDTHPGVIHTTTDHTNGVVARALATDLGLPWVYEMRGQLENTWVTSRPQPLREVAAKSERVSLLRDKETELAQHANAVVVLSEVQKQDLVERGVDPQHVHVIPNSVDQSLLDEHLSPAEARRAVGLPEEGFWVGSVSSLVGYEGFDVLLQAVRLLVDEGIDARCVLVGDGVARPGLEALADDLHITDRVLFPGRKSRVEARIWHQALDVFAVPRVDSAVTRVVTPLKIVEAMALARPVVASRLPALEELVATSSTGLMFAPGDPTDLANQLQLLAGSARQRTALGATGRGFAAERTWQNAARKILTMYKEDCDVEIR